MITYLPTGTHVRAKQSDRYMQRLYIGNSRAPVKASDATGEVQTTMPLNAAAAMGIKHLAEL